MSGKHLFEGQSPLDYAVGATCRLTLSFRGTSI